MFGNSWEQSGSPNSLSIQGKDLEEFGPMSNVGFSVKIIKSNNPDINIQNKYNILD